MGLREKLLAKREKIFAKTGAEKVNLTEKERIKKIQKHATKRFRLAPTSFRKYERRTGISRYKIKKGIPKDVYQQELVRRAIAKERLRKTKKTLSTGIKKLGALEKRGYQKGPKWFKTRYEGKGKYRNPSEYRGMRGGKFTVGTVDTSLGFKGADPTGWTFSNKEIVQEKPLPNLLQWGNRQPSNLLNLKDKKELKQTIKVEKPKEKWY